MPLRMKILRTVGKLPHFAVPEFPNVISSNSIAFVLKLAWGYPFFRFCFIIPMQMKRDWDELLIFSVFLNFMEAF